jgi:peroxiredoxin
MKQSDYKDLSSSNIIYEVARQELFLAGIILFTPEAFTPVCSMLSLDSWAYTSSGYTSYTLNPKP